MIARPVTVAGLVLLLADVAGAQPISLSVVLSGAHRCLQRFDEQACEQTLDQAELLQQRAAAREAYPCQTLLLGLQADLILQQLGSGRSDRAVDDLGSIQRGCAGL
mgnify:FL=1